MNVLRRLMAACGLFCACSCIGATDLPRHQREDVLGTSFEMIVAADDAQAQAAVDAALAEIGRLDAVLSTWQADSELSRLNRGESSTPPSNDLAEVLAACETWLETSNGVFSCRLGGLIQAWKTAAESGVVPERQAMRQSARTIARIRTDDPGRAGELNWQVDGLAKGHILDKAMHAARRAAPAAGGIKLDIGGDALYWGEPSPGESWQVAIADPNSTRDNSGFVATLALRSQAIAASGHGSRGFQVGRRRFSHILDATTGWPVEYGPSATVVAGDAVTADALATALSAMPIAAGLALVESMEGAEALIVGDQGVPFVSSGWHRLLAGETTTENTEVLKLEYEIPAIDAERYRRPYLAIWITSTDGVPVEQLLVLGNRSRWLRDLPQWWRAYGRDDNHAAHGIARATREPGRYTLGWDGRDGHGHPVPAGEYLLHVEAAREHGGHEVVTLPFRIGSSSRELTHQGEREVGEIRIEIRPLPETR